MSAVAAALALIALADPFCSDVQRLTQAAREPFAFQSLREEDFKPMLLAHGCFPGGEGFFCQQSRLPAEITQKSVSTRIAACLRGAKIAVEKQPGSRPQTVVSADATRFEIEESGADGGRDGRILRIQVVADR
ncbi:hypothetical protein [Sphingomonas sp.]|jgi:hypothetical protein|uniref:hypothetical protein n=1 Tax=Sphingomonas sp. TaxID=28214 RepID=UPI002ED7D352